MIEKSRLFYSGLLVFCLLLPMAVKADPPDSNYVGKSMQHGGVYYFALSAPNRIERFDLVSGDWLTPIALSAAPTSLWVGDDGIFAGLGRRVVAVGSGVGQELLLGQMGGPVDGLFATAAGNLIAIDNENLNFLRISLDDPSQKSTRDGIYQMVGISIAPGSGVAFARDAGVGPSDIHQLEFDGGSGNFVSQVDSPYHGDYPDAARTFVFPDGVRVADDSGTVYNSADLTYSGDLGGNLVDIDFVGGDVPVVLRGSEVRAYANSLHATGSVAIASGGLRLAVRADDVLVFFPDGADPHELRVESYPLAGLNLATPGAPKSPVGLSYDPEDTFVDGDGVVHLLSKANASLFRWSSLERRYISTIPLEGSADVVGYSAPNQSAYLGYVDGAVTRLDLSEGERAREQPFAQISGETRGIVAAGEDVLVGGSAFRVFSKEGDLLSTTSRYGSEFMAWGAANRLIYDGRRNGTGLRAQRLEADGTFGSLTPHQDPERRPAGTRLWVNPIGTLYLTQRGDLYNAHSLDRFTSLPSNLASAVWLGDGEFLVVREVDGRSLVERYVGPPLSRVAMRFYDGEPRDLLRTDHGIVLISMVDGAPRFTILGESDLSPTFIGAARPEGPRDLVAIGRGHDRVEIGWTDVSDSADGFEVEYRVVGDTNWSAPTTVLHGEGNRLEVSGFPAGTEIEFRVSAFNEVGTSEPPLGLGLLTSTRTHPDAPIGEPYSLLAERALTDRIILTWADNADNETGFRLHKSRFPNVPLEDWEVIDLPADSERFVDTAILADKRYYYRIDAVNGEILGDLSPRISVSTPAVGELPGRANVVLAAGAPGTVELSWPDYSGNEDGFIVMRSESSLIQQTGKEIARVGFNVTSFTDSGLEPGKTYYYSIFPYNEYGIFEVTEGTPIELPGFTGVSAEGGGILFMSFHSPDRIERYELATGTWLEPIPLWGRATVLTVHEDDLYVGRVGSVVRIDSPGGEHHVVSPSGGNVTELVILKGGQYALKTSSGFYLTGLLSDLQEVGNFGGNDLSQLAAPPGGRRVFAIEELSESARVGWTQLRADGEVHSEFVSTNFPGQPGAQKTWMFPDGSRIIADSGAVFGTGNVTELVAQIGAVLDVAFAGGDVPVALVEGGITAFDQRLNQTGSMQIDTEGAFHLDIEAGEVLVFYRDRLAERGVRVDRYPVAGLNLAEPTDLDGPEGVAFVPDEIFLDKNGIAHLYASAYRRLFRWSPVEHRFLPGIPLDGFAVSLSYSPELHRIYTRYQDGSAGKIDLGKAAIIEQNFAEMGGGLNGAIVAAGRNLVELRAAGAPALVIYNMDGGITSERGIEGARESYRWNPATGEVVYVDSGGLVAREVNADGLVSEEVRRSPTSNADIRFPVRVRPDGGQIALGSGTVFDSASLGILAELEMWVQDVSWLGERVVTGEQHELAGEAPEVKIIAWDEQFRADGSVAVRGTLLRMLPLPDGNLLVVTDVDGEPQMTVIGDGLSTEFGTTRELAPEFVSEPSTTQAAWGELLRLGADVVGSGDLSYTWFRDGEVVGESEVLEIEGLRFDDAGNYRLRVSNAHGEIFSDEVELIVGRPATPVFQPGNLLVMGREEFLEYTPDASRLGEIAIAHPLHDWSQGQGTGLVVDQFGRVILSNDDRYLSVYSPYLQSWQHWSYGSFNAENASLSGDQIYMRYGRYGLHDGVQDPTWIPETYSQITAGLDGRIYAIDGTEVVELDKSDGSRLRSIEVGIPMQAVNANADGEIYVATNDRRLLRLTPEGVVLGQINVGNFQGGIFAARFENIAVNAKGDLAVGTNGTDVFISDKELGNLFKITSRGEPSFATWIPHFITFDTEPAEGIQLEDSRFDYVVNFVHSDPRAAIALEAELPSWLELTPSETGDASATISGTPMTDAEAGIHEIVLTANSPGLPASQQRFFIEVEAVNDRPIANTSEVDLVEDQAAYEVDLSSMFTDEEDAVLQFQAAASVETDPILKHSLLGDRLTLTPEPDANGVAQIVVVATDSGGQKVSSTLRVLIAPLPDAPVGSTIPSVDGGAEAAPADLDIAAFFSDADEGDRLTFSTVANSDPSIFESFLIDPESGQLSIRYANFVSGSSTVRVRATDEIGLFAEEEFIVDLPEIPQPTTRAGAVVLNRQTGLFEQRVVVTNTGKRAVGGVELTVAGLAGGASVYNASRAGDSEGQWRIEHGRPLEAGASVSIWVEYYSRTRTFGEGEEMVVRHQLPPDESANSDNTEAFSIDRVVQLPDGAVLVEFPSIPGDSYRIQYSGDQKVWKDCSTPVRAGGTRVQWIDRGPPKTPQSPSEVESRFYRILKD